MKFPQHFLTTVAAAFMLAVFLVGCSSVGTREETANWPAEKMYQTAHDAMEDGNYTRALELYQLLEARYPYGRFAQQAILEEAYTNYRTNETAAAIVDCDRFIRLYPNHPNVDYAYYLKGLVYFREDQGISGYLHENDMSQHDPSQLTAAFAAFSDLAQRYPDSIYAKDARARMLYLSDAMGMYQVHVAMYYYNRGAYLSAVNRAKRALTEHPRTPSNEQALSIMVFGYEKLGLKDLSNDAKRVLETSYPKSKYLTRLPDTTPWYHFW
jgi:outer membrane protein assembly factor BamD